MKKHGWNYIVPIGSALALAMILFGAGCEPALQDSYGGGGYELLKGKRDVYESIAALNAHRRNIMPLRAGGNCLIEWYDDDGKKHKENPAITLVLYPPNRLYFKGDILGGEAIRLGTNVKEFWFRIKPEVSTYWWGNRLEAQRCRMGGYLSPETLLEALGVVQVDTNWIFIGGQGGYDTLTLIAADATPVKRIYVDWKDYLIKKIEYFDSLGQVNAVVEMSDYTDGEDGVVVPSRIGIVNIGSKSGNVAIDITLRNIKLYTPTKVQLEGLFKKPKFDGFETIYELDSDCKFIRLED